MASEAVMSGVQGGNILHGAVMGALAAGQGQVLGRYGGRMRTGARLAVVAVVGGTVAELGGGKFANGAMTAAFAFLFNWGKHHFSDSDLKRLYNKYKEINYSDGNKLTSLEVCEAIGGDIAANNKKYGYNNVCAIKLSYAMNYSGFEIPNVSGTYRGGDGKYYFINAASMAQYLNKWHIGSIGTQSKNIRNAIVFQHGPGFLGGVSGHVDVVYRGNWGSLKIGEGSPNKSPDVYSEMYH